MDVTDEFAALITGPETSIALDRGALLIAAHFHPGLDIEAQLGRLDRLAEGCPEPSVDGLRRHLFVTEGFTGNRDRADDPGNSLLDEVLDRRMGIPITLALLMIEVGRRAGIPLHGVGMPGHFLVGTSDGRFVDPFHGGRLLEPASCRQLFHAVLGSQAHWEADFLAPTGPRVILARMLANLRKVFRSVNDVASLRWVMQLRATFPDATPGDRLELAEVLATLGSFDEAARLLDGVAAGEGSPGEADALRTRALQLRSRLN